VDYFSYVQQVVFAVTAKSGKNRVSVLLAPSAFGTFSAPK